MQYQENYNNHLPDMADKSYLSRGKSAISRGLKTAAGITTMAGVLGLAAIGGSGLMMCYGSDINAEQTQPEKINFVVETADGSTTSCAPDEKLPDCKKSTA